MNKDKLVVYSCSNHHTAPTFVHHEGIIPANVKCPICDKSMWYLEAEYSKKSIVVAILRKPTRDELAEFSKVRKRYIEAGGLIFDPFMSSSTMFRGVRIEEIEEFKSWAMLNHTKGERVKIGIYHPIVTYESQRINDGDEW